MMIKLKKKEREIHVREQLLSCNNTLKVFGFARLCFLNINSLNGLLPIVFFLYI